MIKNLIVIFSSVIFLLNGENKKGIDAWPKGIQEIEYLSSIDQSKQPSLIYKAKSKEKRPLLVGLHSWSTNYLTPSKSDLQYAHFSIAQDWHFVHPNFRGENWTQKAMGSEYVISDITSIVEHMKKTYQVDENRIYLIGCSGGGYATLLMAGRKPEIWAGVSAWVPISDIYTWWQERDSGLKSNSRYARHIEKVIGGRPDSNPTLKQECDKRSALTYLSNAKGVNIDINHGVKDGRGPKGSVPFSHSLKAFNKLAKPDDQLTNDEIEEYYQNQTLPDSLKPSDKDPLFGENTTLFRRISGNARVTIFQGGHQIIHKPALNWLAHQRKGQEAIWQLTDIKELTIEKSDSIISR